jgi:hypothetical protein
VGRLIKPKLTNNKIFECSSLTKKVISIHSENTHIELQIKNLGQIDLTFKTNLEYKLGDHVSQGGNIMQAFFASP